MSLIANGASSTDRIEKSIALKAPIERVWRALTDHEEFGTWFRVKLYGPFVPGQVIRGHMTYPGYEGLPWASQVVTMDEPRLFSMTWHPYVVDETKDYADEPTTLIEFRLTPTADGGTHLVITESGFDALPADRRDEAVRSNEGGWQEQLGNIRAHVER